MKAIAVVVVLTACFFAQVFCTETCKGDNDAYIFHVLNDCYEVNGIGKEFLFSLSHNNSETIVVISEYSPPSNCSAKNFKNSNSYPINKCVPDSLEPSNFLYFSLPPQNYSLPFTGAYTSSSYKDCSSVKDSYSSSSRVMNPKFCMQFSDGTSATTNCKDNKEYYDYYFDNHDCTGSYTVGTRQFGCQLGEQESCYFGAQNDPTKEYVLVASYIN